MRGALEIWNERNSLIIVVGHQIPHQNVISLRDHLADFFVVSVGHRCTKFVKNVETRRIFYAIFYLPSDIVDYLSQFEVIEEFDIVESLCSQLISLFVAE